jgi:hypothetical protein
VGTGHYAYQEPNLQNKIPHLRALYLVEPSPECPNFFRLNGINSLLEALPTLEHLWVRSSTTLLPIRHENLRSLKIEKDDLENTLENLRASHLPSLETMEVSPADGYDPTTLVEEIRRAKP